MTIQRTFELVLALGRLCSVRVCNTLKHGSARDPGEA
jgi:hypothetical protein